MIIPGDNRGLRRAINWSRGQPHQCSNLARTLVPATFFFEPAAWGPNGVGVSSEDGTHRLSAEQFVGDSPLEGRVRSEPVSEMGFFGPGNYGSIPRRLWMMSGA